MNQVTTYVSNALLYDANRLNQPCQIMCTQAGGSETVAECGANPQCDIMLGTQEMSAVIWLSNQMLMQ